MSTLRETVISDFSDAAAVENFRISADGTLKKRYGFKALASLDKPVRACIKTDENTLWAVAGSSLYRVTSTDAVCMGEIPDAVFESDTDKCLMYTYDNVVYIIGGTSFYFFDTTDELAEIRPLAYAPFFYSEIDGYPQESINMISGSIREAFNASSLKTTYKLHKMPLTIRSVSIDGVYLDDTQYSHSSGPSIYNVTIRDVDLLSSESVLVVEYTPDPKALETKTAQYCSSKSAFVFEGKSDVRVLLCQNDEGVIYYSEPVLSENDERLIGEYYPKSNVIASKKSGERLLAIVPFGERILVVGDQSIYYLTENVEQSDDTYIFKSFKLTQISNKFGISERSGVAVYDASAYFMNAFGLYELKYNPIEYKYTTELISIPENMGIKREDYDKVMLHVDRVNHELWCIHGDGCAVYSLPNKLWYKFSGFIPRQIFTYKNESAFTEGEHICVFGASERLDNGSGFDAYVETHCLDLGNIFEEKTVYGFGAAFERNEGALLECTLTNDKGDSFSFKIDSDGISDMPTVVRRTHARLGGCYYLVCRATSPANAAPANLRSLIISYRKTEVSK